MLPLLIAKADNKEAPTSTIAENIESNKSPWNIFVYIVLADSILLAMKRIIVWLWQRRHPLSC